MSGRTIDFRKAAAWASVLSGLLGAAFLLGWFSELWPAVSLGFVGIAFGWASLPPRPQPTEAGKGDESPKEAGRPSPWISWSGMVLSLLVALGGILVYAGLFVLALR